MNYVKFCYDVDHPHDMFPGFNFEEKPKDAVVNLASKLTSTGSNFFKGSTRGLQVLDN